MRWLIALGKFVKDNWFKLAILAIASLAVWGLLRSVTLEENKWYTQNIDKLITK